MLCNCVYLQYQITTKKADMTTLTNDQLRNAYEYRALNYKAADQIQKDMADTANSEGRDQDDPEFLNDFWDNYCPEDDGNEWVREDG